MEYWEDFIIQHHGINYDEEEWSFILKTSIKDRKTRYEIVTVYSELIGKEIEFFIGTNEKMMKRLGLPYDYHYAEYSYIEGKKYFDQKNKKRRKIPCLRLGVGSVRKIAKSIIDYFVENGHTVKYITITRETGNIRFKRSRRRIKVR